MESHSKASVETQHHLIIDYGVTNISSDRAQLSSMATRARGVLAKSSITAIADRGSAEQTSYMMHDRTNTAARQVNG